MGAEKYKLMRGAALTGGAMDMANTWERPLGEGGEAAWEGGAAKKPGKSVGRSVERKAGKDGLLRKVKFNIPDSNLQRRWESVSYNKLHQVTTVSPVYQMNLLSYRDYLVDLQRQYTSIRMLPGQGR